MMTFKFTVLSICLLISKLIYSQGNLDLALNNFEKEVNSGYLEIDYKVSNQNFVLGNNSSCQCRLFFIKDQNNQIRYILDYGTSIYIVDAQYGRLFNKTEQGYKEQKDFTDPRQFNNLISFLLNQGFRKQIRQNPNVYQISDSNEYRFTDSALNYTFEFGFTNSYPSYVCTEILMRGVCQISSQKVIQSNYNHLNPLEYDQLVQDYLKNIVKVGLEN